MGDDIDTWRSRIGSFFSPPGRRRTKNKQHAYNKSTTSSSEPRKDRSSSTSSEPHGDQLKWLSFGVRCCFLLLLVLSMTVERNPGPRSQPSTPSKFSKITLEPSMTVTSPNQASPSQKAAHKLLKKATSSLGTRKRTALDFSADTAEPKVSRKRSVWSDIEDKAIVEYFAKKGEWTAKRSNSPVWDALCVFVASKTKQEQRSASSMRARVVNVLSKMSLKEAMDKHNVHGTSTATAEEDVPDISTLSNNACIALAFKALQNVTNAERALFIEKFVDQLVLDDNLEPLESVTDSLYSALATKKGLNHNVKTFVKMSSSAMVRLQERGKPNLVFKFAEIIHPNTERSTQPLIPLDRMPFGMIQYQIEFFHSTHSDQVRNMPTDFRQWQEMMEIEFGTRFNKLFRGPAWSGLPREDQKNPQMARMNVACNSHYTVTKDIAKSHYTTTPEIQEAALLQLKEADPDGEHWLKCDASDLRAGLQQSVRGEWNGDCDILDCKLQTKRDEFDNRLEEAKTATTSDFPKLAERFKSDKKYLLALLETASETLKKKYDDPSTSGEKLKELSWEVVEISTLIEQATSFAHVYADMDTIVAHNGLREDFEKYITGLFKKKRQPAATHVMVIMASNEKRSTKPYALPIQYIPYHTLKTKELKALLDKVKQKMIDLGMKVIGLVTDGEFSSLRTKGNKRATHIAEIIRETRNNVTRLSKKVMESMLFKTGETDNGEIIVSKPDGVPQAILKRLNKLIAEGVKIKDALVLIRDSLFPEGYQAKSWRLNCTETASDVMRHIIGTFRFRNTLDALKKKGVDFTKNIHIPEVDPITGEVFYNREDHNHIYKRMGFHTRDGGYTKIDLSRFHEAMRCSTTSLTYNALIGVRKQNVGDAEHLLSHSVADFFQKKGYLNEEHYVRTCALWHEASDGRGMTQEERREANYGMLNMLLCDWIPWHKEETETDFSKIDINRRLKGVCGFSRETFIAVTTNIISQEIRRHFNSTNGPEHPRAGTTDDVECFFALLHRLCRGIHVTLKDFQYWWQKLIKQFITRIDPHLPFYYWTSNERFHVDEEPSFDEVPTEEDGSRKLTRLHRLKRKRRNDSSIIAPGRSSLPRKGRSLRQTLYVLTEGLPPIPEERQAKIQSIIKE